MDKTTICLVVGFMGQMFFFSPIFSTVDTF